jgi:hypothetical protein
MSQFLQDLLKKAKNKADRLESSSPGTGRTDMPETVPESLSSDRPDLPLRVYHAMAALHPPLQTGETRVYLFLLQETLGKDPTNRQVIYHQRLLLQTIGMTSPATLSRSMKALQKRRLVKWIRKSRGPGERSVIEVCPPWERL